MLSGTVQHRSLVFCQGSGSSDGSLRYSRMVLLDNWTAMARGIGCWTAVWLAASRRSAASTTLIFEALRSPTAVMVFSTGLSCGSGTAMVPELAAAAVSEQQQQRCSQNNSAAGQPRQQPR